MNNKNDIEKAINNLWSSVTDVMFNVLYSQEQMKEDLKILLKDYRNILADREQLKKENIKMEIELAEQVYFGNTSIEDMKQLQAKANAYDSLIEKIKERIKSVERCYQDLIEPYFDKSINTINTSCMTKKEKEEFINKSNCLMIQKTVYEEVLELLDTQRSL